MDEVTTLDVDPTRYTVGDYVTEADAERALELAVADASWFTLDPQVTGHYLFTRPGCEAKAPRIDYVLYPSNVARASGWKLGPVGIEAKASGVKLGRPISQAIDYSRAVFPHREDRGQLISLSYVFIWPMEPQGGPLGSIMSQQRIGSVHMNRHGQLVFSSGQHAVAVIGPDRAQWRFWDERTESMGRKIGSR